MTATRCADCIGGYTCEALAGRCLSEPLRGKGEALPQAAPPAVPTPTARQCFYCTEPADGKEGEGAAVASTPLETPRLRECAYCPAPAQPDSHFCLPCEVEQWL